MNWGRLVEWLHTWQTLISGVLALAAAFISIHYLSKQIRQADEHEQERQRRRHTAVRATLPLALSQVCDHAGVAVRDLKTLQRLLASATPSSGGPRFPRTEPPSELTANLERMIEATDDRRIVGVLSEIIGEMQVLSANLVALSGPERGRQSTRLNIASYMFCAAKIHALASSLFLYARRKQDYPEEPNVTSSMKLMGLDEISHAQAFKFAQNASANGSKRSGSAR